MIIMLSFSIKQLVVETAVRNVHTVNDVRQETTTHSMPGRPNRTSIDIAWNLSQAFRLITPRIPDVNFVKLHVSSVLAHHKAFKAF